MFILIKMKGVQPVNTRRTMSEPRYLSGDEYAHTGGYEDLINCKECKKEFDRVEYQSDTCSECEDKIIKRERESK
jgi:hypothetical protein